MKFAERAKPVAEALPGYPDVYIAEGTIGSVHAMMLATDGFDAENATPDEIHEQSLEVLKVLFTHYLVDEHGEPFEDMVGPDADYSQAPQGLAMAASNLIAERADRKN